MAEKFRFLEHTGDLGMECYGRDLAELLVNGAKGMFEVIVEEPLPGSPRERRIEVEGESPDGLFLGWLRELLFIYDVERFIPEDFQVEVTDEYEASGLLKGWGVSEEVMLPGPIKAVTYHTLKVEKDDSGGWRGRVVFDI